MMQALDAVVFDKDGLLIDSEAVSHRAWELAVADLGLVMTQKIYLSLLGRSRADVEVILTETYGSPGADIRAAHDHHFKTIEETEGIPVKTGARELIAALHDRNVPMAVATSSCAPHAQHQLEQLQLLNFFETVVTGNQIQNGKPQPDIYQEAARRIGQNPDRCLALEDSDPGVLAASRAGMKVIHIPDMAPQNKTSRALVWKTHQTLANAHGDVLSLLPDEA